MVWTLDDGDTVRKIVAFEEKWIELWIIAYL